MALFTDFVFANEAMVGYSIAAVVAIFNPLAIILTYLALRHYAQGNGSPKPS